MSNHLALADTQNKIASKIDKDVTKSLSLTNSSGGLNLQSLDQVMELAKTMAVADVAVRKHLRNKPGACLAIAIQAFEWEMSPFAVANKSYVVNDQIAYEAQLIHAVVLRRAPIKNRPVAEYTGEGQDRAICLSVETTDGQTLQYQSPKLRDIKVQNSPLWKSDPDQQFFYYAVRALARRHFPDVILGIYSRDELEDAKDITPKQEGEGSGLVARLAAREPVQEETGFQPNEVAAELGDDQPSEVEQTNNDDQTGELSDQMVALAQDARKAAQSGKPRELPPIYEDDDPEAEIWFTAYDEASDQEEDATNE